MCVLILLMDKKSSLLTLALSALTLSGSVSCETKNPVANETMETSSKIDKSTLKPTISNEQKYTVERLLKCLNEVNEPPLNTGLTHFEKDVIMNVSGFTNRDFRYVLFEGKVEPKLIQIEVTPFDKQDRHSGYVYRDYGANGSLDEVRRGPRLKRSTRVERIDETHIDGYNLAIRNLTDACEATSIDLSIFEGVSADKLSSDQLYSLLVKSPYFYPVDYIKSTEENAPTVLLFGDNHSQSFVDFRQLSILRDIGINTIGLEGWCGEKVDEKRGEKILNADTNLNITLLKEDNFNLIGLEDPDLQKGLLIVYLERYFNNFQRFQGMSSECDQSSRTNLRCSSYNSARDSVENSINRLKVLGYRENQLKPENIQNLINELSKQHGMSPLEFKERLHIKLRDSIALERVKDNFSKNDVRFMSVILGLFHTSSFAKQLSDLGYNVIKLEDPIDLGHLD